MPANERFYHILLTSSELSFSEKRTMLHLVPHFTREELDAFALLL